eukprot:3228090-Pyramimonas_sp.AAC.1
MPNARVHEPSQVGEQGARRRGGGGAWRAYTSTTNHGIFRNFRELAAQYRAISNEELAYFKSLGKEGTKKHREHPKGSSFGPTVRDETRAAEKSQRQA